MLIFDAPPPAIILPAPYVERRFGLSYGLRVAYDQIRLPGDFRDATIADLLAYLPAELRDLPSWALRSMLFTPVFFSAGGPRTVTFIITTSGSDQDYTVPTDWTSSNNSVEIVSAGGTGGNDGASGDCPGGSGGSGGGGGYARKNDITLTGGAIAKFRLRAGGVGTGVATACWFNGTSLAASSVGIQSGGNGGVGGNGSNFDPCCHCNNGGGGIAGVGAPTASGVGDELSAGGAGVDGIEGGGTSGGGGAAGPSGAGGAGSGASGGTGDAGTTASNSNGTQWDATHGSGGGGNGGVAGGRYGGGGGNATAGHQGLIVVTSNGHAT